MLIVPTRTRRVAALLVFLCSLAGVLATPLRAEKVTDLPEKPGVYVTDTAGVLSDSSKASLDRYLNQLDTQAHAQVVVAVIKKIDGDQSAEEFAHALFQRWGPGKKGSATNSNRGVLLFLSIQDRKRWIEVGYGLEGILPDGKVGDIGRDMVPGLRSSDYDGAVTTGVHEIGSIIAQDAGITLDEPAPQHTYHREAVNVPAKLPWWLRIGGLGLIVVIIWLVIRGSRGGGGGGGGIGGRDVMKWLILDSLLNSGRRGGGFGGGGGFDGGGGGWGGGDSGGGGFSGGGGDSGGGGAGGSW